MVQLLGFRVSFRIVGLLCLVRGGERVFQRHRTGSEAGGRGHDALGVSRLYKALLWTSSWCLLKRLHRPKVRFQSAFALRDSWTRKVAHLRHRLLSQQITWVPAKRSKPCLSESHRHLILGVSTFKNNLPVDFIDRQSTESHVQDKVAPLTSWEDHIDKHLSEAVYKSLNKLLLAFAYRGNSMIVNACWFLVPFFLHL